MNIMSIKFYIVLWYMVNGFVSNTEIWGSKVNVERLLCPQKSLIVLNIELAGSMKDLPRTLMCP